MTDRPPEYKISAIRDGTVIDHIPAERTFDVVDILNLRAHPDVISLGMNLKSKQLGKKGIVKIAGRELTKEEVDEIAVIAPKATINIIKDFSVIKKEPVALPEHFSNIIRCPNPNCITNKQKISTLFHVVGQEPLSAACHYCERVVEEKEIVLK
ncbi:aspartate carbamoyltransferase regulatory subunit [Candidatus Woesearchaeota archaeon]|nr:aspartate carbamoyltransferase regulatory subunit [Candidatus Woesearchaeota archaeon]